MARNERDSGAFPANPPPPDLTAIRLLVLDVDGVLTDGGICLDDQGRQWKRFDCTDGAGMKYWQRSGRQIAIISGRSSPAVIHRAGELGITLVRQNAKRKLPAYQAILRDAGVSEAEAAVMGDDLPDVPLMRRCGFALAPANAVEEVRRLAGHVTRRCGGAGAVREAIEYLLRAAGAWDQVLRWYDLAAEAERPGLRRGESPPPRRTGRRSRAGRKR
jgi:3-deoxy-D-manno-octulosonate 8-phosphate phosphatase (KDO 8-P phosphatase)